MKASAVSDISVEMGKPQPHLVQDLKQLTVMIQQILRSGYKHQWFIESNVQHTKISIVSIDTYIDLIYDQVSHLLNEAAFEILKSINYRLEIKKR